MTDAPTPRDGGRAFATEAGDRLLAQNANRDRATVEWLTNDIRAIEQEEYDKVVAALTRREPLDIALLERQLADAEAKLAALREARARAGAYLMGLPIATCGEPLHILSFEALTALGFIDAALAATPAEDDAKDAER